MTGDIRLVDIIDVLLVSALVAALLIWVRRIRVGRVAVGVLAIVVLYLAARYAGMSLLSGLFEGTFALFVLIAVVIFQKELRRLFETISWPGSSRLVVTSEHGLDMVVEMMFDFANRGIGALVVIPLREPIDTHVSGGVELDGKLSRPLIHSLFEPHSPGHDGAAVLAGDRITRFAVHLPLSTNHVELTGMGTRHAAALGLSEHCDALCVVVSEERKHVSLARGGALTIVHGAPELRALLAGALPSAKESTRSKTLVRSVIRRHWMELAASIVLVVGLWAVLVSGTIQTERTYELPVRLRDVPVDFVLERIEPERVRITFRGASSALVAAKAGDFQVAVDVAFARIGQRSFSIEETDIHRPFGIEVVSIEPRRIELIASER